MVTDTTSIWDMLNDRHSKSIWSVWRHSGRAGAFWRERKAGPEQDARAYYQKEADQLRAGYVALFNEAGEIVTSKSGPWLRSRW